MIVGVDTGGTFTDFVVLDGGRLYAHKVPSTPDAPERAIIEGLKALKLIERGSQAFSICHGSTVATNALLEGKGARTAFITNEGFEDVLLLGRQSREFLYDLTPAQSKRIFPNTQCFGASIRCSASGELLQPLTEPDLDRLIEELEQYQPESVAINLLFSYLEPEYEEALAARLPDHLPITLSSRLLPKHGEYERGVSVWLNAWLGPLVEGYLSRLQRFLPQVKCSVMQSSGVTIEATEAAKKAVHLLLSGPAGGVAAGVYISKQYGEPLLLTFDMGGTSTDVSLVMGTAGLTDQAKVGPYPVAIPMIDIQTIGAGGGSLASLDAAGMLIVGPASAGAKPGPACYDLGGDNATVTDANLYLGHLLPESFLGGRMQLNPVLAETALSNLAQKLGSTPTEVAEGILQIVNERMVQALRMITLERGHNPTEFTLCCFGGAGGLHLCALAESLEIKRALIPEHSGVLSAFGMVVAPAGRELSCDIHRSLEDCSESQINNQFSQLRQQGQTELKQTSGIAAEDLVIKPLVGLRYEGQLHSIRLPWRDKKQAKQDFIDQYRARYGFNLDKTIELAFVHLSLTEAKEPIEYQAKAQKSSVKKLKTLSESKLFGRIPVFDRQQLPISESLRGPAIVIEDYATILVLPQWSFTRRRDGLLELFRDQQTT